MANLFAMWHTEGRRQPGVLGKDSAGKRIPGGPYTSYQMATGAAGTLLALGTSPLWKPLLQDQIILQWGLVLGLTYAGMRAGSKADYTNVASVWHLFGGVRAVLLGLCGVTAVMSSTGKALQDEPKPITWGGGARVIGFVERDTPAQAQSPTEAVEPVQEPGRTEPGAVSPPRRFVSRGRRVPRQPEPTEPLLANPAEELERELELVPAGSSSAPSSALESFLSAARPTGALS